MVISVAGENKLMLGKAGYIRLCSTYQPIEAKLYYIVLLKVQENIGHFLLTH
jgi:hypothetical protein